MIADLTQLARRSGRINGNAKQYAKLLRQDPCSYCGNQGGTVDHIDPYSLRGGAAHNLTAACEYCNSRKGDEPLLIWLIQRTADNDREC